VIEGKKGWFFSGKKSLFSELPIPPQIGVLFYAHTPYRGVRAVSSRQILTPPSSSGAALHRCLTRLSDCHVSVRWGFRGEPLTGKRNERNKPSPGPVPAQSTSQPLLKPTESRRKKTTPRDVVTWLLKTQPQNNRSRPGPKFRTTWQ
jgi:hypothetical protein